MIVNLLESITKETLIKSGILETCAALSSEVGDIQGGMPPCSVIP